MQYLFHVFFTKCERIVMISGADLFPLPLDTNHCLGTLNLVNALCCDMESNSVVKVVL